MQLVKDVALKIAPVMPCPPSWRRLLLVRSQRICRREQVAGVFGRT
jgi:hypothetical protein